MKPTGRGFGRAIHLQNGTQPVNRPGSTTQLVNGTSNDCDDWNEDSPVVPSGVGNRSGFGGFSNGPSSGSFGSKSSSGFSSRRGDSDNIRGGYGDGGKGGFSSGGGFSGGGGKGCFNCGEDGHMSRDCPKPKKERDSRGGTCYNCGEGGHMSRDCPQPRKERGSGGRDQGGCFNCGEDGHMSRDCPKPKKERDSRGGTCYNCGESGHMSRDCPEPKKERGSGGFGGSSSNSGGFGSRPSGGGGFGVQSSSGGGFGSSGSRGGFGVPSSGSGDRGGFGIPSSRSDNDESGRSGGFGNSSSRPSGGSRGASGACHKCQQEGHFARECPNVESTGGNSGACHKCQQEGHFARDCPNVERTERKTEYYVPPEISEDDMFNSMQKGINFDKYDQINVKVTGENPPRSIGSFDQINLPETVAFNVKRAKYDKPTPIQKTAIPIIMEGRDLMACAQTGSGKTAAFLLPVIMGMLKDGLSSSAFSEVQEPQALIVAPTRELAQQIFNEARKFSNTTILRPVICYGGASVQYQLSMLSKGAHIVIGTPGRLLDFIGRGKISLKKVKYFILDEADRMLDLGFEPKIRDMVTNYQLPDKFQRQTLMFSATFPDDVQTLASDFLNNYLFVTVGVVGGACTDVEQVMYSVQKSDKRTKLMEILRSDVNPTKTLVFVETKRNADFLATYLSQSEFPTTSIHGDRLQREREEALRDFKTGKTPVMIATSVAARGLDIAEVSHVINYDMPKDINEYVHRIGRTGRCGNLGKATSFFTDEDSELTRPLIRVLSDAQQEVPPWLEELGMRSTGTGSFASRSGHTSDMRGSGYASQAKDDWYSTGDNCGGANDDEEVWD